MGKTVGKGPKPRSPKRRKNKKANQERKRKEEEERRRQEKEPLTTRIGKKIGEILTMHR